MARQISDIQQQMIDQKDADPVLSELDSPSQVAIWLTWSFITATAISILEQVIDIYKAALEETVSRSQPGSPAWIRDKVLKFQYSTDPDSGVTSLVDFVPQYTTVNSALRIVTNCAVVTTGNKQALIKVAKGNPASGPLSGPELTALQAYMADIGFAGVKYTFKNNDPDYISVRGRIYYNGQYSPVISNNVISAITTFIVSLPFNGVLKVSALIDAIQAVQGVTNVVLDTVTARANGQAFPGSTVNSGTTWTYQADAGYLTEESEPGYDFLSTLEFIAE